MTLQEIQETLKILDSLDIEECLGLMQERIQPKLTDMEIELLRSCGMEHQRIFMPGCQCRLFQNQPWMAMQCVRRI